MRNGTKYLTDLTNNLIGIHRLDKVWRRHEKGGHLEFLTRVSMVLETQDVSNMNPETLGKIMCSIDIKELMIKPEDELLTILEGGFNSIFFCGDGEKTLRRGVAICLAYLIWGRLDPSVASKSRLEPYRRTQSV
jgi:hypothetical protein